jgi:putative transposase
MDFVTDRLEDGRYFRALTVIDQYDRSSLGVVPALSFSGAKLGHYLDEMAKERGYPESITCDNGPEYCIRAFDSWAHLHHIRTDDIRPGRQD